jgi:hypothetical protein
VGGWVTCSLQPTLLPASTAEDPSGLGWRHVIPRRVDRGSDCDAAVFAKNGSWIFLPDRFGCAHRSPRPVSGTIRQFHKRRTVRTSCQCRLGDDFPSGPISAWHDGAASPVATFRGRIGRIGALYRSLDHGTKAISEGLLPGTFLTLYGLFRCFIGLFREPDPQLGLLGRGISMGQVLSLPMILVGSESLPGFCLAVDA